MSLLEKGPNIEDKTPFLWYLNFEMPKPINVDKMIYYEWEWEINENNLKEYRFKLATLNQPLNFLIKLIEKYTQIIKTEKLKDIKKINLKIENLNHEERKRLSSILLTNNLENKILTKLILDKIEELNLEYNILISPYITKILTLEKDYSFIEIQTLINYYKKTLK